MVMGKVVGTVVASQKDSGLDGFKLQIVQTIDPKTQELQDAFTVAVDAVGAGGGEIVLCTTGSSSRMTDRTESRPVDAVIVAIVDTCEFEGQTVYSKD